MTYGSLFMLSVRMCDMCDTMCDGLCDTKNALEAACVLCVTVCDTKLGVIWFLEELKNTKKACLKTMFAFGVTHLYKK